MWTDCVLSSRISVIVITWPCLLVFVLTEGLCAIVSFLFRFETRLYRLTNLRVQRVKPPLLSLEYLELAKKTPDLGVLDHADSSQRCFARSFSIAHEIISDFRWYSVKTTFWWSEAVKIWISMVDLGGVGHLALVLHIEYEWQIACDLPRSLHK